MDIEVGKRLKELRGYLEYSQKDFANKYGMSQQALSKYEKGQSDISDTIKKSLNKDYHLNLNWLLTGKGSMFVNGAHDNSSNELDINLSYKEMLPILNEIADLTARQKEMLSEYIRKLKNTN